MNLKTLKKTDVQGKTILYRSPYDIETHMKNGKRVLDDLSRMQATIPTLKYLLEQNCKIVVLTWVGRPDGKEASLSTEPHAHALSKLLDAPVAHLNDCVGDEVNKFVRNMKPLDIVMLENTRFYKEEFKDDDTFAKELTKDSDIIVFDAFPQAHRKHSSTTGILRHLPSCAGFYFEKEFTALNELLTDPKKPFTVIIGGIKISDKVDAVKNLFNKTDIILVGGVVANVFLTAEGKNMGDSVIENKNVKNEKVNWLKVAKQIQETTPESNSYQDFKISQDFKLHKIQHPHDLIVGNNLVDSTEVREVTAHKQTDVVPQSWAALDIGPGSVKTFLEIINQSETILWVGPLGAYENSLFENGTKAIARAMSNSKADTIVAGGDTIEALNRFGTPANIKHISLAGGAALEILGGKKLPVIKYLEADS